MPQIPTYTQRTTAQALPGPASVPGIQGLGEVAQAAQNIGNVGLRAARADAVKQERDAAAWAGTELATVQAFAEQELVDRSLNVEPGAPDFTKSYLETIQERTRDAISRAPTASTKQWLTQRFIDLEGNLSTKAKLFEANEGIRYRGALTEQGTEQASIAVRSDPSRFEATLGERRAAIDSAGLPPKERERQLIVAKESLALSAVRTLAERDPVDALKRLRAAPGESGVTAIEALSPRDREWAINDSEVRIREIERERKAREAEAKAEANARAALLKDETDNALRQYKLGFGLPQNFGQLVTEVDRLPDDNPRKLGMRRDLAVLNALDDNGFLALTPRQQKDWATALETDIREKGANPASILMLDTAKGIQGESERRAKADPFRFVVERGIVKPPQQTGDVMADLTARAAAGRQASAYLGEPVPGFTAEELDNLAAQYQAGGVEDRLGILTALNQSHGEEQASAVYAELDKKNQGVMALAGVLTAENRGVGKLVVRGQVAIKEQPNILPGKDRIQPELDATLRDAYGLGTSARRSVEGAVKAAYAALSADAGDLSGEVDADRFKAAVDAVTGGLVMFGGRTYPAPKRGVSQGQFEAWAGSLNREHFANVAGITPEDAERIYRADGGLVALGPNRYGIAIEGLGGTYLLRDTNDKPLTVSYTDTKPLPLKTRDPEARPSLEWSP